MLPSFDNYCRLIASLPNQYPYIQSSTLSTYTIGAFAAEVEGQITFSGGYVLDVWELLDLSTHTIRRYSYKLERAGETIWWYDPQEHPNDPTLASTHPHHKHIHPDIKHHRVPTPDISFNKSNLPFLIREVGQLLNPSGG
jgi:hypothetical protein